MAEPAAAVRRAGRGGQAARPRQRPRGRRPREPRRSRRTSSATASTSGSSCDDGTETGAWMSLSIAAHELIYVADAYGANGRLHHLAFWVDTREECLRAADLFVDDGRPDRGGALEARGRTGLLPLRLRARREPDRGDDRRLLRLRPRLRADRVDGGRSARAASSGACKTIESFHTYGTPDVVAAVTAREER